MLLASPKWHDPLEIIKGFRNGIIYGVKVRFPHALVMTLLWKRGSIKAMIKTILRATYQHARNLGQFAVVYKLLNFALNARNKSKDPWKIFMSASVAGYLVFGTNNSINSQVNMYLLSRVLFGLCRLAAERGYLPSADAKKNGRDPFPLFAALVWGFVLTLFEYNRHTLQPSLQSSMTYIYDDSKSWTTLRDFFI